MSATFSDSPSEPNGPIKPAVTGDPFAVGPLDFSGSSLFFPENSIGSAPCTNEPIGSPQSAAEAAALSDALCAKISPVSFGDRVFLLPSEADAWRSAVEMVRRYHGIVGRPKRRRFIVCVGASDGTESPPPGLEGDDEIIILRTDDHAALQAEIDVRTAGILIAPVRTRAGFEVVPGSLLARLRETADEYGLILGFDETFCGLGRSGMLWAHEWTGVTPDLMIAGHWPVDAPPLVALVVTQRLARGALGCSPLADRGRASGRARPHGRSIDARLSGTRAEPKLVSRRPAVRVVLSASCSLYGAERPWPDAGVYARGRRGANARDAGRARAPHARHGVGPWSISSAHS